ncbi:MAG: CHAT domain-containing protein [Acidobacteriota bacterium]|nr:CHAT domain-containing protein [Acidobacteriota bacterium]
MQFDDFTLDIYSVGAEILVHLPGVRPRPLRLTLSDNDLERLNDKIEKDAVLSAQEAVKLRSTEEDSRRLLKKYGEDIFDGLFCNQLKDIFIERHNHARSQEKGLRIRIRLDEQQQSLGRYPFEAMYFNDLPIKDHLSAFGDLTLVRTISSSSQDRQDYLPRPEAISPPLRILMAVAQPDNMPDLNAGQEIAALLQSANLPGIQVSILEKGVTVAALIERARVFRPHILHMICHGGYDADEGRGFLYLEDGPAHGDVLRGYLAGIPTLRLVTLNACQGSRGSEADLFSAVAMGIFTLNIPAVVAMQYKITNLAAIEFAKHFYSQLAMGWPIDEAMTMTRLHLRREIRGTPEWATPVLYMATRDGDLFGLEWSAEELLQHTRSLFRQGHLEAALNTTRLISQKFDNMQEDTAVSVKEVRKKTEAAWAFYQMWTQLQQDAKEAPFYKLLANLATLAPAYPDAEMTLRDNESPAFQELVTAIEAVRAFDLGDYDRAGELSRAGAKIGEGETSPNRRFGFDFLREKAGLEKEAVRLVERLDNTLRSSSWSEFLSAVKGTTLPEGSSQAGALKKMKDTAYNLEKAMSLYAKGKFGQACKHLGMIAPEQGPPDLNAAARVLSIGSKVEKIIEARTVDLDGLETLQQELDALIDESAKASNPTAVTSKTPGFAEVRDKILVLQNDFLNQRALTLYDQGMFTDSGKIFKKLGNHRYARACDSWRKAISLLSTESWDKAKKQLGKIPIKKDPRVNKWQRWCITARRVVPVLKTMASGRLLADPVVPWEGGESPYKAFPEISPESTMEACKEIRELDHKEKNAYDALRKIPQRLTVDFYLYTIEDKDRAGALAKRLCSVEEGVQPGIDNREIVRELGEDGGVFRALMRNYDAAITFFLQRVKVDPAHIGFFHHLGLAAAAKIHWLEMNAGDEDDLVRAWEHLIWGWGPVFADDRFWQAWYRTRDQIYGQQIGNDLIQDARIRLRLSWLERMRSASEVWPDMDIAFQAEVNGARAVQTGEGLPVSRIGGRKVIVGFSAARELDLVEDIIRFSSTLDKNGLAEKTSWQRRFLRYFSDLAGATVLFEEGRYAEAVAHLSGPRCELFEKNDTRCAVRRSRKEALCTPAESCPCFRTRNPAFAGRSQGARFLKREALALWTEAHLNLALKAVSAVPAEIDQAITHWRAALAASPSEKRNQTLGEIRDMALGRAGNLTSVGGERRLEALNDAVELLETVYQEGWEKAEIRDALVKAVLDRAVYLANEYDNVEDARQDTLHAFGLAPDSLRVIVNLCQASMMYATHCHMRGEKDRADSLLEETKGHLAKGLSLYPGNSDLVDVEKELEHVKEMLLSNEASTEVVSDLTAIDESAENSPQRDKLVDAMIQEATKNYAEAAGLYSEILAEDMENHEIKVRLAYCLRSWIHQAVTSEDLSLEQARRALEEALKRFPDLTVPDTEWLFE